MAIVFETDVAKFPCVSDGFGLSVIDGYGQDGVRKVVVEYEDVVISS